MAAACFGPPEEDLAAVQRDLGQVKPTLSICTFSFPIRAVHASRHGRHVLFYSHVLSLYISHGSAHREPACTAADRSASGLHKMQ